MVLDSPFEQRDGALLIYLKDDQRRGGLALARICGVISGLLLASGILSLGAGVVLGWFCIVLAVITGAGALLGLGGHRAGRARATVDPTARVVTLASGKAVSFDDVAAISLSEVTEVDRTMGRPTEQQRHRLELMTHAGAAELVADHADELVMACAGARVARLMGLALRDLSSDTVPSRSAAELGTPLLARLQRDGQQPPDPGPPPSPMQIEEGPAAMDVQWQGRAYRANQAVALGILASLGVGVGLLAGVVPYLGLAPSLAFALAPLAPGLLMLAWRPPYRLHLDAQGLTYKAPHMRSSTFVPAELHDVRVSARYGARVAIMIEEAVMTCEMEQVPQARWLAAALRSGLWRLATEGGPYR